MRGVYTYVREKRRDRPRDRARQRFVSPDSSNTVSGSGGTCRLLLAGIHLVLSTTMFCFHLRTILLVHRCRHVFSGLQREEETMIGYQHAEFMGPCERVLSAFSCHLPFLTCIILFGNTLLTCYRPRSGLPHRCPASHHIVNTMLSIVGKRERTLPGVSQQRNRVPQCIYEMSVEKLIHCMYIHHHYHWLHRVLDIENVWECKRPTCDRIADCTIHCRTLSTAVCLHQELLCQLLWLNRPRACTTLGTLPFTSLDWT